MLKEHDLSSGYLQRKLPIICSSTKILRNSEAIRQSFLASKHRNVFEIQRQYNNVVSTCPLTRLLDTMPNG